MNKKQVIIIICFLAVCFFIVNIDIINTFAEKIEDIGDIKDTEESQELLSYSISNMFFAATEQELYEILSEQLMNRSKDFYINYQGVLNQELKKIGKQLNSEKTETYWKGMYTLLQNMAEFVDDPTTTSDSDYLTGIIDSSFIYYVDGIFCFESMEYYETEAQTKKVDVKIKKIVKKLKLSKDTEPEIIVEQIHKYIIQQVTFDHRNENKCYYSAYHGLFKQKTVCNGYALLAYKMLNMLDIPCKYISGMAKNEDGDLLLHAWNIVKIKKKWYNLDVTWDDNDDGRIYYDYFLRGSKLFNKDHKADSWYKTDLFLEKYKISKADYKKEGMNNI